jgi:transposase-like protein
MANRRIFSAEFKTRVVLEMISGAKGLMQASREYKIKDTVLSRWKQEFLEHASEIFEQPQSVREQEASINDLERMVGRLTMQLELSKKALSYANLSRKNNEQS